MRALRVSALAVLCLALPQLSLAADPQVRRIELERAEKGYKLALRSVPKPSPAAGVTAWNALFKYGHLQPGQFVLLEGTGGVSIFGLQFAAAAGARPVITSSSDAKLERARTLGAIATINYRTSPDWDKEVMKATGNQGVSHVLEIGGKDTLTKALSSLGLGGHVALIGGVTGFDASLTTGQLTGRMGSMTSVYVGSREDFEAMNAFIDKHKLRPVIDKSFPIEEATAAFDYLQSGSHFGKVIIKL